MGYDRARASALKLLTNFGKSISLTRVDSGGVYDPVSGETTGGTTISVDGVGVLLGYKGNEINGTTILADDRKLVFHGDLLAIGDEYNSFRVFSFSDINPDESGVILTIAQLRK